MAGDPNDCEFCDGYGFVWNNADPTSGQFHICEVCQLNQFEAPGHPALVGPTRSTPGVVGPFNHEGSDA